MKIVKQQPHDRKNTSGWSSRRRNFWRIYSGPTKGKKKKQHPIGAAGGSGKKFSSTSGAYCCGTLPVLFIIPTIDVPNRVQGRLLHFP